MSIETQYYSQATPLFTVSKTEFSPVPDVNGLVVDFHLHLPEDRAVSDAEGFLVMVRPLRKAAELLACPYTGFSTHGCTMYRTGQRHGTWYGMTLCYTGLLTLGFGCCLGSPGIFNEEEDAAQLPASTLQCSSD